MLFRQDFGECPHIFYILEHIWYNSEVYMVSENVNSTVTCCSAILFLEKLHNLH